jgi:hypothetical protein
MKNYKMFIAAVCALFLIDCAGAATDKASKTPSETIIALHEASKKKDTAAIKKMLSKGTLVLFDNAARSKNTTADEMMKDDSAAPFNKLPEIRRETIVGETATVTVKSEITGNDDNIPFVKEDGEWKVAVDKYQEQTKQGLDEEMNNADVPMSNSNSETNVQPKNQSNKK